MFIGGIVKRAVTKFCIDVLDMPEKDAKWVGRGAQFVTWGVMLDVADIGAELIGTLGDGTLDKASEEALNRKL